MTRDFTPDTSPGDRASDAPSPPEHPLDAVPGGVRRQLPLFAATGALVVLAGLIPFPVHRTVEVVIAGAIFTGMVAAVVALPWSRLPRWLPTAIPVGCVAAIALIRDAQGGSTSGLVAAFLVPVVWTALFGRRAELAVVLGAVATAVVVPLLAVGAPEYPPSSWRGVVATVLIAVLVAATVHSLVRRSRSHAAELVQQSALARREARRADRARRQLASLLAAATETAVIGVDEDARVTFFSAGAEKLLGYHADEVVGKRSAYDFLHPDELERRQAAADLADAKAPDTYVPSVGEEHVWTCRRKDGQKIRLAATITPQQTWTPDLPAGHVVVATDVTQREQLVSQRERLLAVQREAAQILVEQNQQLRELTQMKDDLVTNVSHELRTPLTSIRGFIELMLDESAPALDEEHAHMLRAIDRNSLHLQKVADDLLADPGAGAGLHVEFVDTDLSDLAAEAVDAMAAAAAERSLEIHLDADIGAVVHGDPVRLHQLLGNLLANAVKFTSPGGQVVVRVARLGPCVRLEVLDDGQGIPVAERANLFERFFRLASTCEQGIPGSGLGLAIAKAVVEAHNGTIEVVDVPGWATAFRVNLPAVAQQVTPETHTSTDGEVKHHVIRPFRGRSSRSSATTGRPAPPVGTTTQLASEQ